MRLTYAGESTANFLAATAALTAPRKVIFFMACFNFSDPVFDAVSFLLRGASGLFDSRRTVGADSGRRRGDLTLLFAHMIFFLPELEVEQGDTGEPGVFGRRIGIGEGGGDLEDELVRGRSRSLSMGERVLMRSNLFEPFLLFLPLPLPLPVASGVSQPAGILSLAWLYCGETRLLDPMVSAFANRSWYPLRMAAMPFTLRSFRGDMLFNSRSSKFSLSTIATCSRKNLFSAVTTASLAAKSRSSLVFLSCVLLSALPTPRAADCC